MKKVLLKISQYSQENTCVGVVESGDFHTCDFNKKKLQHMCFPRNIAKCLRTLILRNICQRLLLNHFHRINSFGKVNEIKKVMFIHNALFNSLVPSVH